MALNNTPFQKMHSLGNDFVIFGSDLTLLPETIKKVAHRRYGVGCDQVLQVLPSLKDDVHGFLRIFNADGTAAEACGNGTRCVMWDLARRYGISDIVVETEAGRLSGRLVGERDVEVVQGQANFLSEDPLDLSDFGVEEGFSVSMGNPHLVIPVKNFDPGCMERIGPRLEVHPFFAHKTNVEFVQLEDDGVRLWVWERGAGRTQACASGASAAVFALAQDGLLKGQSHLVRLEGGPLWVTLGDNNIVKHRAEVSFVFEGTVFLESSDNVEIRLSPKRA